MSSTPGVAVSVRLFARYAEIFGTERLTVDVPPPVTVAAVLDRLRSQHPAAAGLPGRPLVAINLRQVPLDAAVAPGDELALLPPLSGG